MIAGICIYCIAVPLAGIHAQAMMAQALISEGRYAIALPILEAARRNAWFTGHSEYASILDSLGGVFYELGRMRDARQVYEEALDRQRRQGDSATQQIAFTLDSLGAVYLKLHLVHKAEDTLEQATEMHQRLGDEMGEARDLLNLGSVYRAERAFPQAEAALRASLAIRERILAPGDREIAIAANNLGALLRDLKRFDQSEPLLERALMIWQKTLPPDHPLIAASLNNLGMLYASLGRFEDAEPYLLRAVEVGRAALPPDHPQLASYMNDYAFVLRKLNRKREAGRIQDAARAAYKRYQRENALGFTVDARESFH